MQRHFTACVRVFATLAFSALLISPHSDAALQFPGDTSPNAFGAAIPNGLGGFTGAAGMHPGSAVFHKEFAPETATVNGSDGLGPVFNEVSCAKCHQLGGVGGAGGNEFNVHFLTAIPDEKNQRSPERRQAFQESLNRIHPGFADSRTVMLHRQGVSPEFASWRNRILGFESDDPSTPLDEKTRERRRDFLNDQGSVARLPRYRGIRFLVTQRNSTSIQGAGLIDLIPAAAIEQVAVLQSQRNDGISGSVSRLPVGNGARTQVGKFGWRGQTATLEQFVRGACVNELGLQLPGTPQPLDPTAPRMTEVAPRASGASTLPPFPLAPDLSENDVALLVSFVKSIPPPRQDVPSDPDVLSEALHGKDLFIDSGCATCHVQTLGPVDGIFSDLLLHDMGTALEDPLPTPGLALTRSVTVGEVRQTGGYSGGSAPLFVEQINQNVFREWRTPPLWGVRDTAPYMHDGRAPTLHDAILAHGGEGLRSAQLYGRLKRKDQQAVIRFLNAIGSPAQ